MEEETDVERTGGETGGEADVVVAGVVDTDRSGNVKNTEIIISSCKCLEYANILHFKIMK